MAEEQSKHPTSQTLQLVFQSEVHRHFLERFGDNTEQAAEATVETFVTIYKTWGQYIGATDEESLRTWVMEIAERYEPAPEEIRQLQAEMLNFDANEKSQVKRRQQAFASLAPDLQEVLKAALLWHTTYEQMANDLACRWTP